MKPFSGIMLTFALLLFGFEKSYSSRHYQADVPEIEIILITAQEEILIGYPMQWKVIISTPEDESIQHVEITLGNEAVWVLNDSVESIQSLSGTQTVSMLVIPSEEGILLPVIEVHFLSNGNKQIRVIAAEKPLRVVGMESKVSANIIPISSIPKKSTPFLELSIQNKSPFTITINEILGGGTDLAWEPFKPGEDILPGEVYTTHLSPLVKGEKLQPKVFIKYSFVDGVGELHSEVQIVSGDIISVTKFPSREQIWGILSVIIGVVVGSIASIIPNLMNEDRARRRQEQVNREYVVGLLHWICLRSNSAISNVEQIDLLSFNDIFKKEELYRALMKEDIVNETKDLWEKAELFNSGLTKAGGAQRSADLMRAIRSLEQKLDQLAIEGKK